MAEYELYFYTPDNVLEAVVTGYIEIHYTLIVNEISAATIVLSGQYSGNLDEDTRIEIYRDGSLVGDTQFFVIGASLKLGADGSYTTEIQAAGAMVILSWPVVNYAPGLLQSHHTDYAGNIVKQLVRQNIGSLAADSGRDMSARLAVQADTDDGAAIVLDVGWRRLLDSIKEAAALSAESGTAIYYDIVKSGNTLELQTFAGQRGTDRSTAVVLSPERGNLTNVSLAKDYSPAASRVIVAGTGQELWRNVVEVANTAQANNSPWGYIKEHFYSTDRATTTTEAVHFGEAYLNLNANKVTLSGTPLNIGSLAYGVDYRWGDKITIEFLGYIAIVSLDRVSVRVRDGAENVEMDARGAVI